MMDNFHMTRERGGKARRTLVHSDGTLGQEEDGTPILQIVPWRGQTVRVWCQYCDCWHYHSNNEGHRCAHCHPRAVMRGTHLIVTADDSPYKKTGYTLKRVAP